METVYLEEEMGDVMQFGNNGHYGYKHLRYIWDSMELGYESRKASCIAITMIDRLIQLTHTLPAVERKARIQEVSICMVYHMMPNMW